MGSVLDRTFLRTIPTVVKSDQARLVLRCALLEAPLPAHLMQSSLTPLPSTDTSLECIPDARCRPFVSTVLNQLASRDSGELFISSDDAAFSKEGLISAKLVLLNLIPKFSIENTLPRRAIPLLRKRLSMPSSLTTTESKEFQDIAPEVFELLHCVYKVGNKAAELQLKSFMEGLAGLVEDQEVVHPPPWEPIPETYNPPKFGRCYCLNLNVCSTSSHTGIALYFTDSGMRGRYARRYDTRSDDEESTDPCTHKFVGRRRKTGGIFNWFCPHGFGYGTSLIMNAEGRKDAMHALYTHCERPPRVVIYDFACQLEEYSRNREPDFFADTQYVLLFCFRVCCHVFFLISKTVWL